MRACVNIRPGLRFRAALAAAAALLVALAAPARAEVRRLVVVHTNDLHGQLLPGPDWHTPGEPKPKMGGFAAVAAAIEAERARAEAEGAGFLALDAGDFFHGSPEGDATKGAAIVEVMNLMGYDAVCLGNHELAYGLDNVSALAKLARFPILTGNVWPKRARASDDCDLPLLAPLRGKKTGGLHVAVVGVTTETASQLGGRLRLEAPREALPRLVAEARKSGFDLVVALTHIGSKTDLHLAETLEGCPLIVGGHDHVALDPAPLVGDVLVVQAGEYGHRLGKVVLDYDTDLRKVVRREATLLNLFADAPRSPTVAAAVEKVRRREFDEVVATISEPVRRSFSGPSPAGVLACEAIREAAGAEIAVLNETAVRSGFARGPVTRRDVYACVPFQEPIVTVEIDATGFAHLLDEGTLHVAGATPRPAEARTWKLATTEFLAYRSDALRDRPRKVVGMTPYEALLAHLTRRSPARGGSQ